MAMRYQAQKTSPRRASSTLRTVSPGWATVAAPYARASRLPTGTTPISSAAAAALAVARPARRPV